MKGLTKVLMDLTVKFSGPCPQLGVLTKKEFMTGKKRAASSGTEQMSVAEPPPFTPVRNQIDPRCPIMHLSPVVSNKGFTEVGIDIAHCHHSPVSVGNWPCGKPCEDATFIGTITPMTIIAIAKILLRYFIWSCSLASE